MDSSSIILFDANMYKVEVVCFVASFKVDDGEKNATFGHIGGTTRELPPHVLHFSSSN